MKHAHTQALIVFQTKISYYYQFAPGLGQSDQTTQKLKMNICKKYKLFFHLNIVKMFSINVFL